MEPDSSKSNKFLVLYLRINHNEMLTKEIVLSKYLMFQRQIIGTNLNRNSNFALAMDFSLELNFESKLHHGDALNPACIMSTVKMHSKNCNVILKFPIECQLPLVLILDRISTRRKKGQLNDFRHSIAPTKQTVYG